MSKVFSGRANGKLLLTAEYLVLDGARALALPCLFGQSIEVLHIPNAQNRVVCESYDDKDRIWFKGEFDLSKGVVVSTNDTEVAQRLLSILQFISKKNDAVFFTLGTTVIKNKLDFDRQWGLGTSSTLIHNLANWAGVDPYELLDHSFGGSGYDLACAQANGPIVYKVDSPAPRYKHVDFRPKFSNHLYFVYLGKKQNSRVGIKNYRTQQLGDKIIHAIAEVEELNNNILGAKSLSDFEESIEEHENIISNIIGMPKVKNLHFQDLDGVAKSLGAWGGDFVMLTYKGAESDLRKYCQLKGFEVVVPYKEMILYA